MPRQHVCEQCGVESPQEPGYTRKPMGPAALQRAGWRCVIVGVDDIWTCPACQQKKAEAA